MRFIKLSSVAVSLSLLLSACKGSSGAAEPQKQEPVVARVGEGTITVEELKARLDEQPPVIRARYTTTERKKEFLENLVRVELLAQEARKQGLDKDPEILATLEKVMVQKLLQKHAEKLEKQPVSEEELQKFYREHLAEFTKPERVRIGHVFLASAQKDSQRGQVRAEATRLLAELRRQGSGTATSTFTELVRKRSDDAATKTLDGDLGFKTREELTALWGAPLAQAAFTLQAEGSVAEVETEQGIHLLRFASREAESTLTFDMARQRIEARLQMERRSRAIDDLIANLKKTTTVEIDDNALEQLNVQGEAPTVEASAAQQ
jgi:peptidyl-prolyl cis-trans isomerase C